MDIAKPRISRLTAIITQLQSKRLITARELAKRHEVSIRTIYRDIRTLEKSGIPIYTVEGKGYSIMEGYSLPPVMFTEQEANAIITAEKIINRNKDQSLAEEYQNAVQKIRSVLKGAQKDKSDLLSKRIHIRINYEENKTSNLLILLQTAITNFQVLNIKYFSLDKVESVREIEPFALLHTQENWILIAFCRLRKDFRAFRLDCIKLTHNTDLIFPAHKITLREYFEEAKRKWETTPDIPLS